MKQLILCRHAKSDWSAGEADFDRPLNGRGTKDAPKMGMLISQWGFAPDLIVSSPAKRAFDTASYFAKAFGLKENNIKKESRIYVAAPGTILSVIAELPDTANAVILFGHNPGVESAVAALTGMHGNFQLPTCGVVILESHLPWKMIAGSGMSLKAFLIPRIFSGIAD